MKELVKRAQSGDTAAFAKLYTLVYEDLYRMAYYMLGNEEDAKDIVQDAVLAAFEQMARLRRAEAFRSWIFRILVNQCRRKRRDYIEPPVQLPENLREQESTFSKEQQLDVRRAFLRLERDEREVLACRLFGGYSSAETGRLLQMNANTVRSRQSRAIGKLRRWLQE